MKNMPNISSHMIVAKEISKILKIDSDDFIRGNLLPDIIDIEDSHHKIKSDIYMVPDIDYFVKNLDLNNDLYLGYLTHLLLDKHYLEDYLENLYPKKNVFFDGKIYQDYDYLNNLLVKKFNLNIYNLEELLKKYDCKIIKEKLKYNIDCLKQNKIGTLNYLNFENFSQFLLDVSVTISKELVEYVNKYNKLCIRIR